MEKEYQRVNIRLPIAMHKKVKTECRDMSMSISAFFNMLAKNYFKENTAIDGLDFYKALMSTKKD